MFEIIKTIQHFLFKKFFAQLLMRSTPVREIKKILVSGYTGLGHFILRTALMDKINEIYPECEILIIAGNDYGTEFVAPQYRSLILQQNSTFLTKVYFFLKLRREKIDVIFLSFDASPKFLIRGSILAGIPARVGHVYEEIPVPSYYYTHKALVRRSERSEIDINLDLLQALHGEDFQRTYRPVLQTDDCSTKVLDVNDLRVKRYICIQAGSSNGLPSPKRWLEPNFRALIIKLLQEYPHIKIVVVGDTGDTHIVDRICEGVNSDRLKNLSGRTTIDETKSLIFYSRFLICHDSGLLHMGNALGKDVIALYGPSHPDVYTEALPSFHLLQRECDCRPFLGLFPGLFEPTEAEVAMKCPIPKCMERLTVEEVYAKCEELLDRVPQWEPVSMSVT